MAFHEIRLPDDIESGAIGGPMFKTRILELSSGFERRNIEWSKARGAWDIGYGLMSMEDDQQDTFLHLLRDFFRAREGRAHGFRFKDWLDFQIGDIANPTIDNQAIGLGDDSTVLFQIFKRYVSGGINYDREINKIVTGQISVLIENVVQTDPGDYSIDLNTGEITFVVAPASTGGTGAGGAEIVQTANEFDVPVRFDDDHFRASVTHAAGTGAASWPNIGVTEIRVPE